MLRIITNQSRKRGRISLSTVNCRQLNKLQKKNYKASDNNNNIITRRWKTSSSSKSAISKTLKAQKIEQKEDFLFGLKPVDISILPPIYRPPPPPPPKEGSKKVISLTILTTIGFVAYFYFNNKNDSYEYWKAMQTGGVLPGTYDDDEDDDDEDDFEDDEE